MSNVHKLSNAALEMCRTLDEASGDEHHFSKSIRRYLDRLLPTNVKGQGVQEIISKFESFIDHDDGLLNSTDNVLIQLLYPHTNDKFEENRIESAINLLTARTEFLKIFTMTSQLLRENNSHLSLRGQNV